MTSTDQGQAGPEESRLTGPETGPWPDWLADLTPEQRVEAIVNWHAHWCHGADERCSGSKAVSLLLRLLDEARRQAPAPSAGLDSLRERLDRALGESLDRCARCKVCDAQLDAIMAVLAAEPAPDPGQASFAAALRLRSEIADALGGFLDIQQRQIAADSVMVVVVPLLRESLSETPGMPDQLAPQMSKHRAMLATLLAEQVRVTVSNPLGTSWTGRITVLADDPSVILDCDDGRRVCLPQSFEVQPAAEPEPQAEPEPPLPPGRWGRVELPGRREHTGFIADETRFGQQAAVVRDWNGAEIACVYGGPGCQMVWLPAPLKRPEPQMAITAPRQPSGFGLAGDPDDDDPDDYAAHANDCHDENCNGDCVPF